MLVHCIWVKIKLGILKEIVRIFFMAHWLIFLLKTSKNVVPVNDLTLLINYFVVPVNYFTVPVKDFTLPINYLLTMVEVVFGTFDVCAPQELLNFLIYSAACPCQYISFSLRSLISVTICSLIFFIFFN